jgi:hypothetical protein
VKNIIRSVNVGISPFSTSLFSVRNVKFTQKANGSMKAGRMMGLFLIVHGMMHYGVATAPNPDGSPGPWMLDPSTSVFSILGLDAEIITGIGVALVGLAALGFVLCGISVLSRRWETERSRMVGASSLFSLAALLGFFNIYWVAAIGINLALIALFASRTMPKSAPRTAVAE